MGQPGELTDVQKRIASLRKHTKHAELAIEIADKLQSWDSAEREALLVIVRELLGCQDQA
jgi:hypothetical protein